MNFKNKAMKKINNKQGSITLFIIVLIAIIIVVTGSLMVTAAMQFKLSVVNTGMNKTYYINDGAVEEALAKISDFTRTAEIEVNNEMMSDNPAFEQETKWVTFKNQMNLLLYEDSITVENANNLLAQAYDAEFVKQYMGKIINKSTATIKDYQLNIESVNNAASAHEIYILKGLDDYKIEPLTSEALNETLAALIENSSFKPGSVEGQGYDLESTDGGDSFALTQTSEFTSGNDLLVTITSDGHYDNAGKYVTVGKKMAAQVKIILPRYNYVTGAEKSTGNIYKNTILNNSIVAVKDVVVTGGTVTLNGDGSQIGDTPAGGSVYALGNIPTYDKHMNPKRETVGGIILGYNNGDHYTNDVIKDAGYTMISDMYKKGKLVTTNGAGVFTRGNISVLSEDSEIDVSHNVMANSFGVLRNGYAFQANDFIGKIDNNMYLYEDLFIGGDNVKIKIGSKTGDVLNAGVLACLFSGSPGDQFTQRSGTVYITGKRTHSTFQEYYDNPMLDVNSVLFGGLARLDLFRNSFGGNREYYMSGESYFTGRNINYYHETVTDFIALSSEVTMKKIKYETESGDKYKLVSAKDPAEVDNPGISESAFRADHFYEVVNKADATPFVKGVSVEDKTNIKINSLIFEGDVLSADTKDKNKSLGVYQGSGQKKIVGAGGTSYQDQSQVIARTLGSSMNDERLKLLNEKRIDTLTHQLGYVDYTTGAINQRVTSKHISDAASNDLFMIEWQNGALNNQVQDIGGTTIIEYYDGSGNDLYINTPSSKRPLNSNNIDSKDLEGVIVNKGNIYVYGIASETVKLKGALISGASVIFVGDGAKNFTYDEKTIYHTIYRQSKTNQVKLLDVFGNDEGRKVIYPDNQSVITNFDGYKFTVLKDISNANRISITSGSLVDQLGSVKKSKETYEIKSWRTVE